MPALVNSRGYSNADFDVYSHTRKRARVAAPLFFRGGEKKQQPSLDSLPDECLFEIFRRLPGSREKSNSACVSKRWLMLLTGIRPSEIAEVDSKKDGSLKSTKKNLPDLNSVDNGDDDEVEELEGDGFLTRSLDGREATDVRLTALAVGTAGRGGLGKLRIHGTHPTRGVTDVGLSAVARGCPSLRVLSMWKVPSVSDEGLSEIANGCPMLEKLDLCHCPLITDKGLIAVAGKCPNLMSLTLDSCVGIGNIGLQSIARLCPKLESVTIKDCPLVGDQGIASMMCSASLSLKKIKLQNLNISDLSLACIGHYGKAVTDLSLTGLQNVAERGFWVMGNALGLQNLKSFVITSCRGVTDIGLEAVAKGCPSLKLLCLRRSCYLSDAGLKAFVESAKALEVLQLEECNRITLVGVLSSLISAKLKTLALVKCLGIRDISSFSGVLPLCMTLRSLTIRDCPGFTSSSLVVVGNICPNLQQIDLSGLGAVTDAGLLPLIQRSELGLVKVSLNGCVNLTDTVISLLVKEHGDTLQVLSLDGCSKLTDRIPLAIAESCTLLEELNLSGADITDYGVAVIASARHLNLQILSLSGCSKLTQKSLPLLGNMGATLVGLNLQQCNLISTHEIASLEAKMWWCDILS